jgi:hypothetical protein
MLRLLLIFRTDRGGLWRQAHSLHNGIHPEVFRLALAGLVIAVVGALGLAS